MTLSRRSLMINGGAAAAGLLATQVLRPRRAKAQTGVVNLYSSRHYNTDDALYETFTDLTGIRVNLLEGKADELLERLKLEGENSPADVFMTVDAGNLWRADQDNLFASVSSDVLTENIPENLRHPDGKWFGFSKRARVIMYNKDTVDPSELSTYEDLADERWQGRILIRSSSNIYNQSLIASMIESNGLEATEDWARAFVSNFAREPEGNDRAQIEAAAAGLGDIAIANTYYLPRYAKDEDPAQQAIFDQIGVFFPNQDGRGAHVNISGGGVLANAPNADAAKQFLEYLSGTEAQAFFAEGNNEYPVVEDAELDSVVASFGDFEGDTVNVSTFGENQPAAVQLMDRVGWV
ncbi:MAG: Fe(3+) ABC transporter substrate-binding protein [Cyanobacteria bacterium P01_D01_bin.36]